MSQHPSFVGRAFALASTQRTLTLLGVLSIASGTALYVLSTGAQSSDPVQMCRDGCASMTCSPDQSAEQCAQNRTSCESGCASMASSSSAPPSGSGTCDQPPHWPDCIEYTCTSGNWSCTRMNSSMSYSSSSSGTCSQPQPSWPDCAEFSCVGGGWACTRSTMSSSGYYSDPRESWITSCMSSQSLSRPDCTAKCDTPNSGCPSGGTYGSSSAACSGPQPYWPDCSAFSCTNGNWTCSQMRSTSSYGSYPGGGTSATERCFVSATWKRADSSTFGGSLSCVKNGTSWTDCREFTEHGTPVSNANVSKFEGQTSCYLTGGGTYSSGGGYGGGGQSSTSGMRNCQYPTAQIMKNGQQTGMSVWCEGDYQNCHEGSPSGPGIVPGNILSLGAPSACESGWNNSSSWASSMPTMRMCGPNEYPTAQNPCQFNPMSRGTSTTERCFVSATWKRADSSTFGGSLSCVKNGTSWTDCREFTEHGTPVSNANVSKFEGQTSCYLTGGTSGTTGGTTGGYSSMGGTRPCAADEQPFNGSCYLPWGGGNYSSYSGNTGRMCDFYKSGPPPSCVYASPACMVYTEPPVSLSCDDARCRSSWNGNCFPQGSRPNSEWSGQRGYDEIPRYDMHGGPGYNNGGFYPGMMIYPGQGGMSQEQMQQEQKKMMQEQQQRMLQEASMRAGEECGRLTDSLNTAWGLSPEVIVKIKAGLTALVSECKAAVAQAVSSGDPQQVFRVLGSFRGRVGDVFGAQASCGGVEMMLRGMQQGIAEASGFIAQTAQQNPSLAEKMKKLQAETTAVIQKAASVYKSGKCAEAEEMLHAQEESMQRTMQSWGSDMHDLFFDNDSMAEDFAGRLAERGIRGISAVDMMDRGFDDARTMSVASKVLIFVNDETAARDFLSNDRSQYLMNYLLSDASDEGGKEALVAQLIEENNRLKQQVNKLTEQLNAMQQQLAERINTLTLAPEVAAQVSDYIENELPGQKLTAAQADEIFKAIKIQNGAALLENGMTAFVDVDPGEWFSVATKEAKEREVMTGQADGTFTPEKSVNNAEAAVTLARALGVEPAEGEHADDAKFDAYPVWAQAYVSAMEDAGVDLSKLGSDPAAAMKKSDLAAFLAENLLPEGMEFTGSKVFTDVAGISPEEREAFAKLSAIGVVNGVNNGSTVDPDAEVNRAVFAKMVIGTMDAAFEELDVSAPQEQ